MEEVSKNVIFLTPVRGRGGGVISYLDPQRVEIFRVLDKSSNRLFEWFLKYYTLSCNFHRPYLPYLTSIVHTYPI